MNGLYDVIKAPPAPRPDAAFADAVRYFAAFSAQHKAGFFRLAGEAHGAFLALRSDEAGRKLVAALGPYVGTGPLGRAKIISAAAELIAYAAKHRDAERAQAEGERARLAREDEERARRDREQNDRELREAVARSPSSCALARVDVGLRAGLVDETLCALAYRADQASGKDRTLEVFGTRRSRYDCPVCATESALVVKAPDDGEETTVVEARCLSGCEPAALAPAIRATVEEYERAAELEQAARDERARVEHEERRRAELAKFRLGNLATISTPRWIIQDLLPQRALAVLVGEPGARKTKSLILWALCLASGLPLFGQYAVVRTRVLLVLLEGDRGDNACHVRDLAAGLGLDADQLMAEGWLYFQPDDWDLRLDDPASARKLEEAVALLDVGAVGIDNLTCARTLSAGSENDSDAMSLALAPLVRIAKTRSVVLIHHLGKSGSVRGSIAIKQSLTVQLDLTAASDAYDAVITLQRRKTRAAGGGEPAAIKYRFIGGQSPAPLRAELADRAARPKVDTDPKRTRMLELLATKAWAKDDLYAEVGGRKANAVKLFAALEADGLVVEVAPGMWRAK